MKNNSYFFGMPFKKIRMGFSFLGISFFILEILMFFYYENQESDGVIRCATKIVKILNKESLEMYKQCS